MTTAELTPEVKVEDAGPACKRITVTVPAQAVDARIAAARWQKGKDWESRVYEGAEHEENAWAARLPEIMGWLLRGE